jgi:hypothetical protein
MNRDHREIRVKNNKDYSNKIMKDANSKIINLLNQSPTNKMLNLNRS